MGRAAIGSFIAGLVVAVGVGLGSGAAAQACTPITIGGSLEVAATIDAAAGVLRIDAPQDFGDVLDATLPIELDAAVGSTGSFALAGDFALSAGATNLIWRVTSGLLTVNEADQAGTLEITAELAGAPAGTPRVGLLQVNADVAVVDLVQPTPLTITGAVSGVVECGGGASAQGTTPTSSAAAGGGTEGGTEGGADDPATAAQDENLATTGLSPMLLFVGALVALGGLGAVVHGLGRVRFERWFPKHYPGEFFTTER